MASKMNYWESRRSFWTTPKGFILQIAAILIILCGAIVALNLFTSPFPVIEYFEARPMSIDTGESSTLSWSAIGATSVEIDQGVGSVALRGSREVSPAETATFTLTAINGSRNRTKTVRMIVK